MSIVDDLIANLVERNAIGFTGTMAVRLVDGGVRVTGTVVSTLRDQKKNRDTLKVDIPVNAEVKVGTIVIPVPRIP
jgi:pyridoxal biosynthesis lyase PdxS